MTEIKIDSMLNAHASYNDLNGSASLAWDKNEHDMMNIIAKKSGIDTKRYDAIGVSLYLSKKGFGISLFLSNEKKTTSGKKTVKKVLIDMDIEEFRSYLKDINIKLFLPNEEHRELYDYQGEESIENL